MVKKRFEQIGLINPSLSERAALQLLYLARVVEAEETFRHGLGYAVDGFVVCSPDISGQDVS